MLNSKPNFRRAVRFATSAVAACALFVVPAHAQQQGPLSNLDVDFNAIVKAQNGAWADYNVTRKGSQSTVKVRYALVDKTATAMALEIDTNTPRGDIVLHVDFAQDGADAWKVAGGRMVMGDKTLPLPTGQLANAPALTKNAVPGELVGTEKITTPAGTFDCKHYKKKISDGTHTAELDLWMNPKVAPTGLVKTLVQSSGVEMTLQATGKSAPKK